MRYINCIGSNTGVPICINIEQITMFLDGQVFFAGEEDPVLIDSSVEEIKDKISNAECPNDRQAT